jgi:hypothetical protein
MIPSELENPFPYKTVSTRKGVAAMKMQMDRREFLKASASAGVIISAGAEGVKGFG